MGWTRGFLHSLAPRPAALALLKGSDSGQNTEAPVIGCHVLRQSIHSGLKIPVFRIDEKPLSENLVRP